MANAFSQYTLTDIQTALADKTESVPFWTTTEATNAINEALLMWNLLTGYWRDTIQLTTTAGNFEYALPASIVFGTRIEINGRSLAEASLDDMDHGHPGWQAQTTASGGNVPTSPKKWLPISLDLIAIWPADAAGGAVLDIDGVAATPRLVNPSDFINIGKEQLGPVLSYALHVLTLKEGGQRFADSMAYFTEFLHAAAEENDQLTTSAMWRHFTGTDQRRSAVRTRGESTSYDQMGQRNP